MQQKNFAFSLIEIVLVMGIIVILFVLSIPIIYQRHQSAQFNDFTNRVMVNIKSFQNKAIYQKEDTNFGLKIDLPNQKIIFFQSPFSYVTRQVQKDEIIPIPAKMQVETNYYNQELVFQKLAGEPQEVGQTLVKKNGIIAMIHDSHTKIIAISGGSILQITTPQLWWRLDDNASNKLVADSISQNHGRSQKDTSEYSVEGKLGKAYQFSLAGEYLEMLNTPMINFSNKNFTAMLWVRGGESGQAIVSKGDWGASANALLIAQDNNDYKYFDGTGFKKFGPSDNNWHLLAAVREDQGNNNLSLYYDGVLISKETDNRNLANNNAMRIADTQEGGRSFVGYIDEVMFFSQPLGAAEIRQYYLCTR